MSWVAARCGDEEEEDEMRFRGTDSQVKKTDKQRQGEGDVAFCDVVLLL